MMVLLLKPQVLGIALLRASASKSGFPVPGCSIRNRALVPPDGVGEIGR